jgi:cytochrome c-type biogenesis protein CcmE
LLKKKKYLIGGIIIFIAIAFLAVTAFMKSSSYYYTVSQAIEQGSSIYGRNVRVNGTVADSIKNDIASLTIEFTIAEGTSVLSVIFHGAAPDNFVPNADVVVEGKIDNSGVLQADSILTKCPSKYVPED